MENEFPGYEESLKELEAILAKIESGEIGIDEISEMVKRARFLIDKCQDKLRGIEKDLEKTFDEEKE